MTLVPRHGTTIKDLEGSGVIPRRPRLVMSAYSCCPNRGSEPGVGWKRATELARYCDVWVLTERDEMQPGIAAYLRDHGPIPNLEFVFVPRSRWERAICTQPLLNYVAYRRWVRRALQVARRLHAEVRFDLAHHITFNSFREPSCLYELGIPFIWGPVGGAQNYPWRFLHGAGVRGAVVEATRSVLNSIQLHASRRVHAAARTAAAIFAANSEAKDKFRRVLKVDSILLCDAGSANLSSLSSETPVEQSPIRILWAGELSTRKALELLIEALALLPADVPYILRVVGDGRREGELRQLAERRRVSAHIEWYGWLPHSEVLELFRWANVLAFTSLRDTSGNVMLEAFAAGKPVVCLDHQGARDIVTPDCGIKIPVTNRQDVQKRIAKAIGLLYRNRRYRAELGQGARHRAADYIWAIQTRQIAEVYNRVLESAGSDARCDIQSTDDPADEERRDDAVTEPSVRAGFPARTKVAELTS